jgi:thiamine biosynthesis protein ThiI
MATVLVRYGELFLKSENVRRHYIRKLITNIEKSLDAQCLAYSIETFRGRILVNGEEGDLISESLSRIFGVVGVSLSTRTPAKREAIELAAVQRATGALSSGMSFAVRARRSGMEGFSSQEMAASIGSRIIDAVPGCTVNLTNPDYELFVEARDFGGLVYDDRIPGPGGLPYGTQGNVVCLLSGGIDSPVAAWMMMRRGCTATLLNFDGGKWMGGANRQSVASHHSTLSTWCPGYPLILNVMDLEPMYASLMDEVTDRYRCVLCKRFMLRIAEAFAVQEGAFGIVNGDTIGQVATQTLANIKTIDTVLQGHLPLFRPLITCEKHETIDLARRIGTFQDAPGDLSCAVVPRKPAVSATIEEIVEEEEKLDIEGIVERALASVRKYRALNGTCTELSGR